MKNRLSFGCVALSASILLACTSVPVVENRLQTLQWYPNMYVVKAGETVRSIAHRYQLSTAELEALNPGLSTNIAPGLRINVVPGTVLSNEVRARTGMPRLYASRANSYDYEPARYEPARQSQVIPESRTQPLRYEQPSANNQVIVSPAPARPALLPQPVAPVFDEQAATAIAEIPASTWSNEQIVTVPEGQFTEEIVADPLDFEPVDADRVAMDEELLQYVGKWSWPTDGQVARAFAPTEVGGQGVDIAGVPGQSVHAAMAGTVVYSGRDLSGGGNLIIVRHDDSLMTTYSHTDKLYVAEDDQVFAGDPIASLGWNANQESVLRFEVRKDGNPLDPMKFLPVR